MKLLILDSVESLVEVSLDVSNDVSYQFVTELESHCLLTLVPMNIPTKELSQTNKSATTYCAPNRMRVAHR